MVIFWDATASFCPQNGNQLMKCFQASLYNLRNPTYCLTLLLLYCFVVENYPFLQIVPLDMTVLSDFFSAHSILGIFSYRQAVNLSFEKAQSKNYIEKIMIPGEMRGRNAKRHKIARFTRGMFSAYSLDSSRCWFFRLIWQGAIYEIRLTDVADEAVRARPALRTLQIRSNFMRRPLADFFLRKQATANGVRCIGGHMYMQVGRSPADEPGRPSLALRSCCWQNCNF